MKANSDTECIFIFLLFCVLQPVVVIIITIITRDKQVICLPWLVFILLAGGFVCQQAC